MLEPVGGLRAKVEEDAAGKCRWARSQVAEVLNDVPHAVVGLARLLGREVGAERVVLIGFESTQKLELTRDKQG